MVHTGILPHHTIWADFFRHLDFVVLDEKHAYRGLFGSQVANVIRRLKRVARFYGAAPQFILTSATIANPIELAERLIEEPVALVDHDGAARGDKHVLIYNPPVVDRALGLRRSALLESVRLAHGLFDLDIQSIFFARARRTVEVLLRYLSEIPRRPGPASGELDRGVHSERRDGPDLRARAVRGYRSGYLPAERRAIERGLRDGTVRAVVATSALELGIDIGGMEAAILVGFPRHHRGDVAAGGACGPGRRDCARRLCRVRRSARSVSGRPPRLFLWTFAGTGVGQPGQPPGPVAAYALCRVRAAVPARRRFRPRPG